MEFPALSIDTGTGTRDERHPCLPGENTSVDADLRRIAPPEQQDEVASLRDQAAGERDDVADSKIRPQISVIALQISVIALRRRETRLPQRLVWRECGHLTGRHSSDERSPPTGLNPRTIERQVPTNALELNTTVVVPWGIAKRLRRIETVPPSIFSLGR
jgi:hypothetical protein